MGFWRSIRVALAAQRATQTMETPDERVIRPGVSFSSSLLDGPWSDGGIWRGTGGSAIAQRISREEALQVPSVIKARNIIAGSLSAIPLHTLDRENNEVDVPLLRQINPDVPNVVTMSQTIEDLLFEGVSWWRILGFGWDGYPVRAEHVDVKAVSTSPPPGFPSSMLPSGQFPNGVVWVNGQPVDSSSVIRFDSPNPPLLVHCARAIRRALRVERTAEMYASAPRAMGYFTPNEGADPASDDEIVDLLDEWETARRAHATGYVPAALKYNEMQMMSAADLQLVQLQERAALDIAIATGLDPADLGVNVTSRSYNNATDRRRDRINDVLAPYMRAITDRMSMGDITKRGQRVVFDLDDFLRADPATRWNSYQVASGIGALTVDEIRAEEGRPALTTQPPAPAAAAPGSEQAQGNTPPEVPAVRNHRAAVSFARETGLSFDADISASFKVDENTRTITGLAVPYGPVARSGGQKWRFQRGAVKWSDAGRVKLLRDHDHSQAIGKAVALNETEHGLMASFKVARGPAGDEALSLAADGVLDGLSIGIDFNDSGYAVDPTDRSVNLVHSAALREVSLTAMPAFDDSRLTSVAANDTERDLTMGNDATTEQGPAPAAPAAAPEAITAVFTGAVEQFTAAVERLGTRLTDPQHEQREVVSATRAQVREPLVYSLDGRGHSFVQDAWNVHKGRYGSKETEEAFSRIRKYEEQTKDLAQASFLAGGRGASFANAGNTTDQAQIIPPGYRPDLYVGQIPQGRPLFEAVSTGTIANANPFKVPVWVSASGLNGTNSEGTGPSTGTITNHTYVTVTPTAQSGEFEITRELVDSSNPAIDQIALAAMREEYARDTEAVIGTALAAATDDNTAGLSTEGCYVSTAVGDGADLDEALLDHLANVPFRRFLPPNRIVASSTGFPALAKGRDADGRRLFPYISPLNASGQMGVGAQTLEVYGLACKPAYGLTAGTDDVMLWNAVDLWAWESPLLSFRFEEKAGPEKIVLNIWGYFAFQILRYGGVNAVAFTGA